MEDKRKYPRLNWSVMVRWELASDGASPASGTTKDISAGGVRLILREGIKVGDILELDIELGGGKNMYIRGRVTWVEKFKISGVQEETGFEGGVQFLDLKPENRRELERFMMQSRPEA